MKTLPGVWIVYLVAGLASRRAVAEGVHSGIEMARLTVETADEGRSRGIADDQIERRILLALRGNCCRAIPDADKSCDEIRNECTSRARCRGLPARSHIGDGGITAVAVQREPAATCDEITTAENIRFVFPEIRCGARTSVKFIAIGEQQPRPSGNHVQREK